jgi:hypothetical protein
MGLLNFQKKRCNIKRLIGEWCNGSTTDSDSVCLGSNPSSPAIQILFPQDQDLRSISGAETGGDP